MPPAATRAPNGAALAVGLSYLLNLNTVIKTEYRFDLASQPVFLDLATGGYRKSNPLLGASVAVSFKTGVAPVLGRG